MSQNKREALTDPKHLLRHHANEGCYVHKTNVFVRIRPLADSGGHAHSQDSNLAKALEAWSDKTVTLSTQYLFSKGSSVYDFPRKVLGPDSSQEDVYEEMQIAELVKLFTTFEGRNVVFFAYGQTGAGKTHTMLGTDASLQHASLLSKNGWGIFPRVFDSVVKTMEETGVPHVLSASAVEFYLGACHDLLNGSRSTVQIDPKTHLPNGAIVREMNNRQDLFDLLSVVRRNRSTRRTKMNAGSSRSHAAIILFLSQLDPNSKKCCKTCFTIVDLAGAERPEKNGDKRFTSADMIIWEMSRGKEVPIGAQTYIINWELSGIATEIHKATEAHSKKSGYSPPTQCTTEAVRFLGACFDGTAVTSMCLCLSPANVNGWETWFSLQYGLNVSKLRVPVRRQEAVHLESSYHRAILEVKNASEALQSAPRNKFYRQRESRLAAAESRVNELESLMGKWRPAENLLRGERKWY